MRLTQIERRILDQLRQGAAVVDHGAGYRFPRSRLPLDPHAVGSLLAKGLIEESSDANRRLVTAGRAAGKDGGDERGAQIHGL